MIPYSVATGASLVNIRLLPFSTSNFYVAVSYKLMLLLLILNEHRRSQGDQGGHGFPKFVAHVVVFCFEEQCPKPNAVARLNSKYLAPPKFWAGYAINVGASKFFGVQRIFARISPSLPEKLFRSLQNFSHKDHDLFLVWPSKNKKCVYLFFCITLGVISSRIFRVFT